jgi:hypothetical protein
MVGVAANADSKSIVILGHGLAIAEEFELEPGIMLSPEIPKLELDATVAGCSQFTDYAAALHGSEIATFALRVESDEGGKSLSIRAWNALWHFHLLSVACRSPCLSLYSVCDGERPLFSAANPSPFVRPFVEVHPATISQLEWARRYLATFNGLIQVPEFSAAIRCYGNAHILPEHDVRIMLLWAGIEGLLSVDAELSRRLALYAALLFDGSPDEKAAYFDTVKKAYGVRSRAVHGGGLKKDKLQEGSQTAGQILIGLIARCVELGRVPSSSELDRLAVSPIVT